MSDVFIVVAVFVGIGGSAWLFVALVDAAINGHVDADFRDRLPRSDDTLLYGPMREFLYQFTYTRRVAQLERIEQIKKERGLW